LDDSSGAWFEDKDKYRWTSMIRQPEFVDMALFESAKSDLFKKKRNLETSRARFETFTEGLCVQVMHIGSYDDEPKTIATIEQFISDNKYVNDISDSRRHHEIYLNDPRKTASEKLKTIIRHPVRLL
jgi:hypothetical protein